MSKIVQIIPAPKNLMGFTHNDEGEEIKVPILCLALTERGEIQFMVMSDGRATRAIEVINYRNKIS
ncbi:MAG: hypothetical protein ACM3UZ_03830 [Acidobacteriota bacterium]